MRTLGFGILVFFLGATLLLPEFVPAIETSGGFYPVIAILLMISGLSGQAEGILLIKKTGQGKRLMARVDELESEVKAAVEKLHSEKKKTTDLRARISGTEHEFRELGAKLSRLQAESSTQADQLRAALALEKNHALSLSQELEQAVKHQKARPDDQVLSFLNLLQEQGRFLDFVMEQIDGFSDEEVGAAARLVHRGCSQVMKDYFQIQPVRSEAEGSEIILDEHSSVGHHRLVGKAGNPPWYGRLLHKGWMTEKINLPSVIGQGVSELSSHENIIVPAQIELS